MILIDDYFPEDIQDHIFNYIQKLDYRYLSDTVKSEHHVNIGDPSTCPQITHSVFNEYNPCAHSSEHIYELFRVAAKKSIRDIAYELFDKEYVDKMSLYRIKVNGLFQRENKKYHQPHTDWKLNDYGLTLIYYVNDSDGPTYLFNEFYKDNPKELTIHKKILPKKGRIVAFEATRYHASSSPNNTASRFVLNIVVGYNHHAAYG